MIYLFYAAVQKALYAANFGANGISGLLRQRRNAQTTVEYLLMLAVVVSLTLAVLMLFHKKILGGIFTIVGMVIGAGSPK